MGSFRGERRVYSGRDRCTLIIDTGASVALYPFHSNFTTYEKCTVRIKELDHDNMVIRYGKFILRLKYDFSKGIKVETW